MINSVVQFNENHKWCGCLGIVEDVADWGYLIGVPAPMQGTAYIRAKKDDVEYIGKAVLVPSCEEDE